MKCSDPNEGEAVMVGYRDFLPGQDKVPTWETEGAFQPPLSKPGARGWRPLSRRLQLLYSFK